ncbi:MAG: purine-nucleoside phosphorylase, partial [Oscillospiraceae bacterium]
KFKVGDIMFITDHIKLCCQSPFIGECDERLGERFFDMSGVYDQKLLKHSFEIAQNLGIPVQRGVYMYFSGPQYETPAEVRAARILGADAVGMSTVFEAIAAARSEIPVLGISVITNMASGIQNERLSDKHVVENAKKAADSLRNIINEVIETYYEK